MLAALLSFVAGLTLDCQRKRARQAFEIQLNVLSLLLRQGRHALRREQAGARPSGVNEESRATARLFPFGTTLERTQRKG